ncbi:BN159_2729 family protein [[Kitasatospora] papulosa]|uniref:BN159_2729 family protein n=1 Tax=Streptomyces TaxID=1883 RepID=UPI0005662253|nr:BN159_2729 family protein [Streptomyces sp. NRRL S-325]
MNKNLPAAIQAIRALLDSDGDVATTVAHALDGQGLLVDPERTYGTVLVRSPKGWVPVDAPAAPAAEPTAAPATELEQQASHWDTACERARQLAATLAVQYRAESDVTSVRADRDTVVISLHITDLARWTAWMDTLGIRAQQVTGLDYVMCGRTSWEGIPLSVLGYDVPELLLAQAAAQVAGPASVQAGERA